MTPNELYRRLAVAEAAVAHHTPPEWPGLMLEALRRPTIAAAAQRIRGEDLREAQIAVELMLLREVNV